jgi:hypothetical protein
MTELSSIPLTVESAEPEPTAEPEVTPPVAEGEKPSEESASDKEAASEAIKAALASLPLRIVLPEVQHSGAPYWVKLPAGFTFPRGKQVIFMRFKSEWTDTPWKGSPMLDEKTGVNEIDGNGKEVLYRQCICWPINTGDKKLALGRAQKDPNRAADEMSKQMIRAVDGLAVDWTVARENGIEVFWNDLGERCRTILQRIFSQLHILDQNATRDFLQNCIAVRSTTG